MKRVLAVVLGAVVGVLTVAGSAAAQTPCDPTQTPPEFGGEVPELAEVVPSPGGEGER